MRTLSWVAHTGVPPALVLDAPLVVVALPHTACVTTSPPVGFDGWFAGMSTSMWLPLTSTGAPPASRALTVLFAVADRAVYG